ncbi:MAG: FtsX-like permease family protein [Gemmatimonadetes bacterium]|nr:FtsX-like permease family protein [Gemmatimonadota bacterium]NIO32711.1 FtsX-like permease family protein [Gemmatimonadota bacterium]
MISLKFAVRTLARSPFVAAVAVASLALGIGANAAIFSLYDQMLIQALPVPEPDRLVNLGAPGPKPGSQSCNQAGDCDLVFSYPMFRDLQQAQSSFTDIAAHRIFGANLAHANRTIDGQGMLVSGSYFPTLGVRPALGRLLDPADDQVIGNHFVAVLSHHYWTNQLGGDPAVLNQRIIVNGHPMTIVGVAARGFDGTTLGTRPDVFVPISMRGLMNRGFDGFDNRRSYWAYLFARLRPGVSIEQADAEINSIYWSIVNEVEAPLQEGMSEATLERFRAKEIIFEPGPQGQSSLHGEVSTPLTLLFAITAVVLLIACANIANLLLAQGANRSQEMAIRGSLGASRHRLVSQLLLDSCVLAVLGGGASLLVARWVLQIIASILPAEASTMLALELRPSVVLFAAAVSIGTGFLFGMYPALHSTRPDLMTLVRSGSGQPSGARAAARFRASLVTAQIALSMALLVAAGFFIKSLANVSRVDLGMNTEHVITFGIFPQLNGYEPEESQNLFGRLEEELQALPGVTGVSGAMIPVLTGENWGTDVSVQGFESGPDIDDNARFNVVGAGYFSTLGIPLLAGREFTPDDALGAPKVAVVNEVFIRKFGLSRQDAVGSWMSTRSMTNELDIQIVGLIGDAKYSEVKRDTPPLFFTPYRQRETLGWLTFYVRTAVEPSSVLRAIPDVVRRLDANLPVQDLKALDQQVRENVVLDRLITMLSAAFAVLATLLAAIGLYGVLAYTVAQRTGEFGVRMALGADSRRVRRMVLWQVGRMTIIGGVLGIVAGLLLGRAARSLLFGLEGNDPLVIAAVAILLSGVAMGAGYVPALRASRVDPMKALRYE